jgi:hyperosmotically inducible protein
MLKKYALVLSVAALSATVACSKTDSGVTTAVKSKIAADDTVKANDIAVDTGKKVVTLNGSVSSNEEKDRASEIAQNTKGVKGVVNDIAVDPHAAATSGTYDEQNNGTVKSKTEATAHDAKVKTEDTAHDAKVKSEDAAHDAKVKSAHAADKTGEVIADSAITTDVKTKFLAEPGVSGLDIHVDTTNGVVTLSGNVKSRAEADKAISVARGSKGVKSVVNHMKVAA